MRPLRLKTLLALTFFASTSSETFCSVAPQNADNSSKISGSDFFLDSDFEEPVPEKQPESFLFKGETYVVKHRLGAGKEGTAWLVTQKKTGSFFVIKEFFKTGYFTRNLLGLKRLLRVIPDFQKKHSDISAEVVDVLGIEQKNNRLLLSYADGIVGDTLYGDESGLLSGHKDTLTFFRNFEALNTYTQTHKFFNAALTTKNVVWQSGSKKIVIFDPY